MANITTGLQGQKKANLTATANAATSISELVKTSSIISRFEQMLGKRASVFLSSVVTICNQNNLLKNADPMTVLSAAAMAATLNLPINTSLGLAYIVPFRNGKTGKQEAQFILGYKGYIQLAERTGRYKTINADVIYEGEIVNVNRFTGEYEFRERTSDKVIGYMAYFKLINGFEKYLYMSIEEMQAHAKKHSRNYKGGTDKWGIADFNSMAIKTVLRRLLSKYGMLSIEMEGMAEAMAYDGAVIREDNEGNRFADYDGETVDLETGEIIMDEQEDLADASEPSKEEQEEIHELEVEAMKE